VRERRELIDKGWQIAHGHGVEQWRHEELSAALAVVAEHHVARQCCLHRRQAKALVLTERQEQA
jgi:hypothetical protein